MYTEEDYKNFKSMLECFIFRLRSAHLQSQEGGKFIPGMNSQIEGYSKYKNYWEGTGGTGHAKNNKFQNQTNEWSWYDGYKMSMAIKQSQAVKDYTDRANYIYWFASPEFSGIYNVNIAAKWNDDKNDIEGVYLYYSWEGAAKQLDILFFSLQSLGLYQDAISEELKLCLDLYTEMRDNQDLNEDSWKEKYNQKESMIKIKNLLVSNYNLILTGAPGTGKTYLAREIAKGLGASQDSGQYEFVQFHPSYDYTDFVEGLRPKQDGNNVIFERKDGLFKAFCKKAAEDANPDHKYVFVIDEINRGEISKIFGELFFSIDPGYRGETDKDTGSNRVKTQYQNLIDKDESLTETNYPFKKGFYVPSNVYVIGTMNDIDRSVESMDFAFRRRFAFYEVKAKDTQDIILAESQYKTEAIRRMDALNDAIEKQDGFSSAYHIGAAYFKKIDKYSGNFGQLWDNHIEGVLFEYLRGLPNATEILKTWKAEFDK